MLAKLVQEGKLPPLKERLPEKPYVVGQGELILSDLMTCTPGKYSDTLRLPSDNPGGDPHIYIGMNEPLIWAPGGFYYDRGIHGSIVESYEANGDDTVFAFFMRKGLKWSDGKELTTDDVRFAYKDVLLNESITPAFPIWLRTAMSGDGTPAKIEIIDEYTFKISFDGRYGTFPAQLAIGQWRDYSDLMIPAHYMKQFHADYTPLEKLQPLMKEQSIEDDAWWNLFNQKCIKSNVWKVQQEVALGHPTLLPWVIKSAEVGIFTYERNAYYFKVDSEGKQLPYFDYIRSEVVADRETMTLRALMGEFDYMGERSSLKNLALMKEHEAKGKIKVLIPRMHRLPINFSLNLTYDKPGSVWRQVTGDVRFRKALNLTINRQEIIDIFYLGQFAELPKYTSSPDYDVARANRLLDEMGMNKKDGDGFRLGPDGKRFQIVFEIGKLSQDHVPMAELLAEYFKKVGVFTMVKGGEWGLINQRWQANDIMATGVWAHQDIWKSAGWDDYLPRNFWGRLWSQWHTSGGKSGEEPPAEVKDLIELHAKYARARIGTKESRNLLDAIYKTFGVTVTGLFSPQFADAAWSIGKLIDMLKHIWLPIIIIGMAGTASIIRIMRGNLLDELQKQYVITARAKGMPESKVLFRYPVRIAVNPIVSTVGWILPAKVALVVLVLMYLVAFFCEFVAPYKTGTRFEGYQDADPHRVHIWAPQRA